MLDPCIVPSFTQLLQAFQPCFTAPSFASFVWLASGWVLNLRRHTVTETVKAAQAVGCKHRQGNRYAVPYDHVTDILPVRITQRELFVYAPDIRCIARHELARRGTGQRLDPHGFHRGPPRKPATDLDQLRVAYEGMGPGANEFFKCLSASPPRQWGNQARRILLPRERYSTQALDAALLHACQFGALCFDSVQRILEARHPPRSLDEYVTAETADRLRKLLGERTTEPRDLLEYDRLACSGPTSDASHEEKDDGNREGTT